MVEILLNWINNEVKLSKKIENIAEDFSNGYFFGELLYKYKLLPQFNQFRNNNDKSSITKNYILLKYKFDELKINFTDKDKKDILNKKKYKAEMFLFKIREKLLSKLLQIDEITERTKNQKNINKLYKNVINNINPHQKIKSAKKENISLDENKEEQNSKEKEKGKDKSKKKDNKKQRLASARLPKINKNALNLGSNKKCVTGIESLIANIPLSAKDNKLVKDTLKDIEIYENIHMKNKMNIKLLEEKKHKNEELKEKQNLDSWKRSYNKIKKFEEEKKEKELKKVKRLKSATQQSFKKANQKNIDHISKFDKNLDRLGLKSNNEELNTEQKKQKELSVEHYMKSIIEAVKEKESLRKQYEIRTRRMKGPSEFGYLGEDQKDIDEKMDNDSKQRPQSSATAVMFYSNKNKIDNKSKISSIDKNRPITAKPLHKNQFDVLNTLSNKKEKNVANKIRSSRPKSGLFNNSPINNNNAELSIGGSQLSQIAENTSFYNTIKKAADSNLFFDEYINNDTYDENKFFEKVFRESGIYFQMKAKKRHEKIKYNRNNIEKIVYSLLDITDLCYNYKNEHNTKLVDIEEWDKIIYKFINGIPIIEHKKEEPKQKKVMEDLDNSMFNLYNNINEKEIKEFGQFEYDELRNYLYFIGDKYDPVKNSLFVKKCKLGQDKLDINDVMDEADIKILYEEAKKAGKQTIDEDDREESLNHKFKYKASKEEQEILEPYTEKYPFNLMLSNLISESIKFSYDKDPKTFKPKESSKVIEEEMIIPQQVEGVETEGSIKKNIVNENDKSKISEENKIENNNIINEEEKIINIKEIINNIPIRVSFLGVQKTEKKTRAKNMEKKYPGLKVYNLAEFKKNLEENNKSINNENIIELLIDRIREDFSFRNIEDIKKDILKKRENLLNLNNSIEKLKEEQEKKPKPNIAKEIQNIQQQIDKINNESIIGFILISIPENIHQLKLMEKKLMEFTQPCEKGVEIYEKINEDLLFICDQPQKENKEEQLINLFLNKIIHFESNKDVIFQKIDNRKKDPVKGDIYQMNLFPPKDKKVLARLEDILKPTHEEIEQDIIKDINNYELIEDFYKNFNVKCTDFKGYIINENINEITNIKNYMQLLEQNQNELDDKMAKEIEEALNIYEDKIVGPINENINICEESGINENNNNEASLIKEKEKEKEKEKKETDLSGEPNNKNNQIQSNKKEIRRDSNNSSMTLINDISRINSNKNVNTTQGELSISQNFFTASLLSEIDMFNTYHTWKKLIYFYTNQYYKIFNKEKKLGGGKIIERLNLIQKEFIQFLSRPSDKKIVINQFLNKYREFANKCKYIQNTTIAKARYLSDIDELNETLWKIVEIRKFESLDKINNFTNIIDQELNICYNNIEQKVILETQKFLEIINIILRFISKNNIIQTNQTYSFIIENPVEEILRKCDDYELAEYNEKTKKYNYPKANRIYKNCLSILIKLNTYLSKSIFKSHEKLISTHSPNTRAIKRQKNKKKSPKILSKQLSSANKTQFNNIGNPKTNEVQCQLKLTIKAEIEKYKYIIYNLYINSLETLSKIFCASKLVFKLMDDWVADSIQFQDNAIGAIFNKLKKFSIEEIISNKNILSEDNIYKNIELDDFNKKYIMFNYDDFLSDGKSDENKNLSIDELNNKDIGNNINKIIKIFSNIDNNNSNNINNSTFGELIALIKDNEIQKGIIKKTTFEKIFFINKIIMNTNKTIFPQFFYKFDFHNISLFLSHFIKLSTDFIDKISNNDINDSKNDKEIKNTNDNNNDINEESNNEVNIKKNENDYEKIIPQELIITNQIFTILFLICFKIIPKNEVEKLNNENESKLINGKFLNKNDFISNKFWFEDIINTKCKTDKGLAEQFKIMLFDINENNNGLINFIEFIDLISLKSLKFEDPLIIDKISNYYNLFYN